MAQASTSGAGSEQFLRNVFLLKNGDFEVINGQIHMPTMGQMATIRIRTDQYKRGVEFNTSMSSDMVKEKLEKTFPYLKDKGFSCAAKRNVDKDTAQFDFDRSSCPWNGETIKKKLQGNSALYILEDDQMDTSSGISASDSESSQGLDNYLNCDVEDVTGMLQDNFDFVVECNPAYSPVQGGGPCVFTFVPELPSKVTSVYATFEGLGTQKLEFLKLGFFPASRDPQVITVRLTSQDGGILGYTRVTYVLTKEQQVVSFPSYMREFFEDLESGNPCGNPSGNSGSESESLRTLGCKKPAQLLSLLVYVAAEIGAQQFIEIIFTSSARRVVHNAYKRNLTLPETVARDHGYIETANYLADVTKRFSEEASTDNDCSQTVDWSELVKAAEAAEKKLDLTNERQNGLVETNDPKETGYLADADTSSSGASAPPSSDSEDDISNKTKTTATAAEAAADAETSSSEASGPQSSDSEDILNKTTATAKATATATATAAAAAENAETSSIEASAPQSSDSEDDISNKTKTTATAAATTTTKATAAATTETRKDSVSDRECQIGLQKVLHKKDRIADNGDPIAGNYRGRKKALHQFDIGLSRVDISIGVGVGYMTTWLMLKDIIGGWRIVLLYGGVTLIMALAINKLLHRGKNNKMERNTEDYESKSKSGKTGETGQQGDLHRKDPNRLTGNPIAINYLDRKETLHQFEVVDIPTTSDFMTDVKRINILEKPLGFHYLPKAQKQDIKDLKERIEKMEKLISKATYTTNSLRTAANKPDEVWKSSKKKKPQKKVLV